MSRPFPSLPGTQRAENENLLYRVGGSVISLVLVLWLSLLGDLHQHREKTRQTSSRELEALAAATADRFEANLIAADVGLAYLADLWRRSDRRIFAQLVEDYLQSPTAYATGTVCVVDPKGKVLYYSDKLAGPATESCRMDDKAQAELMAPPPMPPKVADYFSISPAWLPTGQSDGVRMGRPLTPEKGVASRWITMTISGEALRQSLGISSLPLGIGVVLVTGENRLLWHSAAGGGKAGVGRETRLESSHQLVSVDAPLAHYPVSAVASRAAVDVFSSSELLQRRYYALGMLVSIVLVLGGTWLYSLLKRQNTLAMALENARGEQLLPTENPEASRIAREIHDDLGQKLMVLRMDVAMLACKADEEPPSVLVRALADLKAQVDGAIASVRTIVRGLQPAEINTSLIPAVNALIDVFRNTFDITIDFNRNFSEVRAFDAAYELTAFRMIQESFSNVVRHAQATHIRLNLEISEGQLKIRVQDNGVGFSFDKKKIALRSIEERATLAGGKVFITNMQEGGACVEIYLPLGAKQNQLSTMDEVLT